VRRGRELGRRNGFGPSIVIRRWEAHSPQTLDATFLKALVGSRPPPSFWPPPPSPPSPLLSLPQVLQPPPILKLFAAALPPSLAATPLPSPLLQVSFFLAESPSCGCKFRLENWWEEGRRKGRTQGGGLPDRT
jgi:hypothetical protein